MAAAEEEAAAAAAKLAAEGAPQYGGTLVVTMAPSVGKLDPLFSAGEVPIIIHTATYDNLLMIQTDLSVKPELATSWEPNDDFTSYTFHLRKGVKFHHGKDFKAEDVVFNVDRWIDPEIDSPLRGSFKGIEEMVVLDDYTIRFDLDAPNAFFPSYFSFQIARIVPSDIDLDRLASEEFGTGPFIIDEYLPGERTTLVPYDDYWEEGKPYLDELVILSISEQASRDAALKRGDVDLIYRLPPLSAPGLEAHPNTTVLYASTFGYITLSLPTVTPPFDNLLVRQALQAATDRVSINQAALLGLGEIGLRPPHSPQPVRLRAAVCPAGLLPRAGEVAAGAGRVPGRDRRHLVRKRSVGRADRNGGGIQRECCARGHSGRRPESDFRTCSGDSTGIMTCSPSPFGTAAFRTKP